jgi:hypothetical protein
MHQPTIIQIADPPSVAGSAATVTAELAGQLEAALARVGAFGEVRLVVIRGRVRFVETVRSEDAAGCPGRGEMLE